MVNVGIYKVAHDFARNCGVDVGAFMADFRAQFPKPYAGMAYDAKEWAISKLRAA